MKITIYELLGLIKDGKAPKKIKVFSKTFELIENTNVIKNMYVDKDGDGLFDEYWWSLNDEVEILDEKPKVTVEMTEEEYFRYLDIKNIGNQPVEDEFIDIEELEIFRDDAFYNWNTVSENRRKINDLIKNQKKIINKLKEEGK